ncbi:probable GPI-anchored adhesin-like protein PGA55 [Ooceraea biroi]|uniref:probable GPI-anchored adhesin-like protein PGA55 n=1 Tax=Ooceraea biroi TaxID=2015173 RepID=UPI000F081789|nr:probable GPI-anchored adhesin-like protein PGA55 [Ooceraea biroi]
MPAAIFYRRNPTARRENVNTQPQTTESANRLTIKPAVTIGNSIMEAFPEEAQVEQFSSSIPQNTLAYLTRITPKSKSNQHNSSLQQEWEYVQLDKSLKRKSGMKNYTNDATIYYSTTDRTLRNLTDQSQIFSSFDDVVRSLILKHNTSLKDNRNTVERFLQPANDHDNGTRKTNSSIANTSKFDYTTETFNVSTSNITKVNSFSNSKKRKNNTKRKNSKTKNRDIKTRNNTSSNKEAKKKSSDAYNTNATKSKSRKRHQKVGRKIVTKINNSSKNNTDLNNIKRKHRFENVTTEVMKSAYEEMLSTESNFLTTQQELTTVTQQINDSIYGSDSEVAPALHRNNLTTSEVLNETIYMTTSETTINMVNDTNVARNSSVKNSNRRNRTISKKNPSKSPRRKHGSTNQKHYDEYSSSTTTMRTTTEFGNDVIDKTDAAVKDTTSKNIYAARGTLNVGERNTQEKYIKTKSSDLATKKDYFLRMIKKHHNFLNYYNKYNFTVSKIPIPVTESSKKIKKDVLVNTTYDPTQEPILFAPEIFVTEPETAEIKKINYSLIKIESLPYESHSPNVELTRYIPTSNQVFESIDKISKNLSNSSYTSIQRNPDRSKGDCSPNKMHKQSKLSRKFHENNESLTTIKTNNSIDSGLISSDEEFDSTTADNCTYSLSEETRESRETLEEESKNDFDVFLNWSKPSSTTTSNPEIVTQLSENGTKRNNGRRRNSRRRNDHKNNRSKNRQKNHDADRKKKHTTVRWQTVETTSVDYGNDYSPESRDSSRNDPRYDKADDGQNRRTGRSDWFTTNETTTEYFKMKSSGVDESVTEHLAKDSTRELQSEGTTNVNLIADSTTSHLSTASDGKSLRKSKVRITTTTESSWFDSFWSSNNEETPDEESIDNKDVTSFPVTSSSTEKEETKETRYYSVSPSNDFTSTYDESNKKFPLVSTTSSWKVVSKEDDETNDEERSITYSTIKSQESNERGTTDKLISNERSNENSEEALWDWFESWDWEAVTHSAIEGITHDTISDLDSEEEENGDEKTSSEEDNEIENGVTSATEDYETEHCDKNQHACDKYTCIDEDKVCDGTADCPNSSDEIDCQYIDFKRREHMNGEIGKPDYSKDLEVTSSDECSPYEHPCDGGCINALSVCDGEKDCLDGTDEENCTNLEGTPCTGSNISWVVASCSSFLLYKVSRLGQIKSGYIRRETSSERDVVSGSIYHLLLYRKWL